MEMRPNEAFVRQALAATDAESFHGFHSADALLHVPGRSRLAGTYQGIEGIERFFEIQRDCLDPDGLGEEDHDLLASDDHVVRLYWGRYTKGGKVYGTREAMIFHFLDGKIAEVWILVFDQDIYDSVWS